ncbi:MAG: MoaF N-terminal domain-containing protein [Bacteroidota bacterium]
MNRKESMHLLDGRTIDYTYDGGWRFRVRFYEGLAAYDFLGESGENVSDSNADIPYQSRLVREDLYHVVWHETNIGDLASLVIDVANKRIYSAALLGYHGPDLNLHFEGGDIHSFTGS